MISVGTPSMRLVRNNLLALVFAVLFSSIAQGEVKRLFHAIPKRQLTTCAVCVPCVACTTTYKAGENSSDLQVHIRGTKHNVLEIFFNENLERYNVPNGIDLCSDGGVIVAAKNDLGTFAISYGKAGFTAFGWKGNKLISLTTGRNEYPPSGSDPNPHVVQIDVDAACPIQLEWVTTRVLRITHGPRLSLEYVVRFDGDSKPWKILYSGPVEAP